LFTTLLCIAILIITALINLYAVTADTEIQSWSPQADCSSDLILTQEAVLRDFKKGEDQQGLMYCYCKDYYLDNQNGDVVFPDGKKHCEEWLKYYSLS
jgi:hypothetical protein